MRVIVYTGKGGVGKTSVSAATALHCAEHGSRTLVISTDTAHSLGDSLHAEIGPEPTPVAANLDAQEIDVHHSIERYWGDLRRLLVSVFTAQGADTFIAEEVAILPGLEEGASLLWLNEYAAEGHYDVVVVDAAPTAETLRLLTLPEATRWWVEKIIPGWSSARLLSMVARGLGVDAPDPEAVKTVEQLFDALEDVRDLLSDESRSSMRLVVNAERMVIKEAQRTYTYLSLYGYPVDAVICNRLIPDHVTDPYFAAWKAAQAEHLNLIHECFDPLPLLTSPLFDREVGGLSLLRQLGTALFAEHNPIELLYKGQTHSLDANENGTYDLTIPLPFADRASVDLYRSAGELTLGVGAYRRNVVLPRVLWPLEVESAKLREGILTVHFTIPDET